MSENKTNAANKSGNTGNNQDVKATPNTKNTPNTKATPNTKNTPNTKATPNTKNTQTVKSKSAAKKKAARKLLWITIALCVSVALNIALIIILVVGNKNAPAASPPSINSPDNGNPGFEIPDPETSEPDVYSYSEGIAENGFWENIRALDYVELFDYRSFSIPREIHEISDNDLRSEINNLLESYSVETRQITDRAVINGDKVNIDYVGSVDGVEFENGSTMGQGADVTAGSTDYIDDFLTQLIGHMPGETFNVEVTFPQNYGQDHLNGKDAVFVTTINYIVEYNVTDDLVIELLYDQYGWKTVIEMENGIRNDIQTAEIENYVRDYMANETTLRSIPGQVEAYREKLAEYVEKEMLAAYQGYADSYGMELDDFIRAYIGASGADELVRQTRENIMNDIKRSLAVQAIAEDAGISVGIEDMENYLPEYSSYEDQYGMPWLKQYVLGRKVIAYIIENAVFV